VNAFSHVPVLMEEAVSYLHPVADGDYLDGTFGGGGYARRILEAAACKVYAIDRDPAAVARGAVMAEDFAGRLRIFEGRISEILVILDAAGVRALDGAVVDLGVSSYQIDDPARGFSFRHDGPLDMRMGKSEKTAADLVNFLGESELADMFFQLGEEKASRRVAAAIVARRGLKKFETTSDLAGVIRSVVRPDKSGIDPATRTFQALRLAVNDELLEIEVALAQAASLLVTGGRLVVVSFHSLEDRIVKQFFAKAAGRTPSVSRHAPVLDGVEEVAKFKLLTAKPVIPGMAESQRNPRARSAKLRAMERVLA